MIPHERLRKVSGAGLQACPGVAIQSFGQAWRPAPLRGGSDAEIRPARAGVCGIYQYDPIHEAWGGVSIGGRFRIASSLMSVPSPGRSGIFK